MLRKVMVQGLSLDKPLIQSSPKMSVDHLTFITFLMQKVCQSVYLELPATFIA